MLDLSAFGTYRTQANEGPSLSYTRGSSYIHLANCSKNIETVLAERYKFKTPTRRKTPTYSRLIHQASLKIYQLSKNRL